jgi:uroporphyrinogen decarboxylase
MVPQFEEKVLEEREDSRIVQDWKGNVCEISSAFDVSYLRSARDFVTRRWIRCPVEGWADWEAMKPRYDPQDPSRVPADLARNAEVLRARDHVVGLHVHGPFWQMREWMGFEGLCMAFIEQPDLIEDMVRFWTEYVAELLMRVVPLVQLDYFHISEDMAYKVKPMIGPAMCRRFLMPCWAAWGEVIRAHACPVYQVDSDGFVGDLIPVWMEAGINATDPLEVAAGNDLPALRRRFGRQIAYCGGVDKRCMARGGKSLREELARLTPVVHNGGYIPSCDHGVPPDINWPNFVDYARQLARITGWL